MSNSNSRTVTRKRSYPSSTPLMSNPLLQNAALSYSSSSPSSFSSSAFSSFVATPSDSQVASPYPAGAIKKKRMDKRKQSFQELELYPTTTMSVNPPPPPQYIVARDQQSNTIMDTPADVLNVPGKHSSQRSVPAFLHKLFNMVEDPSTTQLIRWSKEGNSFLVEGHEEFAKSVLPRFYKHNTFASFVRQLNMYDFHKIPHIQQGLSNTSNAAGTTTTENEVWEFSNPHFQRNCPDLLVLVTRKRNRDRDEFYTDPSAHNQKVNLGSLVKEITAIRKHQTNITADLRNLHRDNEIIWKETLAAREKHQKHQQIISKILQFLTAVFSNEQHQLDTIILPHETNPPQQIEPQQQPQQAYSFASPPPSSVFYQQNNISHHQQNNYYFLAENNVHTANSSDNSSGSENNGSGDDDDNNNMTMVGFSSNVPLTISTRDSHKSHAHKSKDNRRSGSTHGKIKREVLNAPTSTLSLSPQAASSSDFNNSTNTTANRRQPFTVTRYAEAITNDIDELQENVETLAAQLGIDPSQLPEKVQDGNFGLQQQFTTSYSNMISSASKNDKMRLFELADDKVSGTTPNGSPQMQPLSPSPRLQHNNMHHHSSRMPTSMPLNPQQQPLHHQGDGIAVDPTTTGNAMSFYYSQLLKSVDPYHPGPSFACDTTTATAAAHVNNNPTDNTIYQSNPNPRVISTTVAYSPSIAAINHVPSPSILIAKQQSTDTSSGSHHGTPNAPTIDTTPTITNNPYASSSTTMYNRNNSMTLEEVQAFRSSVLSHQQLQDQRFHHLQLNPGSRPNSRSTSLTTTPTAFFDQQLAQQQAYFRNQYPPLANPHPQSPIVVAAAQQKAEPVYHPITTTATSTTIAPTITPTIAPTHTPTSHSFHPHAATTTNPLEQLGQMNINNYNYTQPLLDVAAANSITNYMNQPDNEKEDDTIVY